MIVHLPQEYPLKLVSVEGGRRTGVSEAQWRSWLLSAQMIMASPSGSLLDAVLMWKQNIEKRFSGVEPCAICYATISGDDATLPAKTCRTCAQKFHNGCLVSPPFFLSAKCARDSDKQKKSSNGSKAVAQAPARSVEMYSR